MTVEPFTLRVRPGLEYVDGQPVGLVYLVDCRDPLVEILYPLPIREALALSERIASAAAGRHDPIRATARGRDGHAIEVTLLLGAASKAIATIRRHAATASALRARREVAA